MSRVPVLMRREVLPSPCPKPFERCYASEPGPVAKLKMKPFVWGECRYTIGLFTLLVHGYDVPATESSCGFSLFTHEGVPGRLASNQRMCDLELQILVGLVSSVPTSARFQFECWHDHHWISNRERTNWRGCILTYSEHDMQVDKKQPESSRLTARVGKKERCIFSNARKLVTSRLVARVS